VFDELRKFRTEIGEILNVSLGDIIGWDAYEFLVAFAIIDHPKYTDRARRHHDAMRYAFIDNQEGIKWITVITEGIWHIAIISRVSHSGSIHAIEREVPGVFIHLILIAFATANLYYDVYDFGGMLAGGQFGHG
jgi:hypothetical protein